MRQSQIDPYRIARAMNAHMVEGASVGFGNFNLLRTTADMVSSRPEVVPEILFSDSDDEVIRKAFEKIRVGLAVDRFLADPTRAKRLTTLCRKLGLKKPPAAINRRLLALRKQPGGRVFKPTTVVEPRRDLMKRFGPAVEAAMTKIRVLKGASVDDLLADVVLGAEFESLAKRMIAGGSPEDYRLCALHVRKNRHLDRNERSLFESIDLKHALNTMRTLEPDLQSESSRRETDEPGIVLLTECGRPLYLSRFDSMKLGAQLLHQAKLSTHLLADSKFWKAAPEATLIRFVPASTVSDAPLRLYELRLIQELNPAFNWPIRDSGSKDAA